MAAPVGRITAPEPVFQSPAITRNSELLPEPLAPKISSPSPGLTASVTS